MSKPAAFRDSKYNISQWMYRKVLLEDFLKHLLLWSYGFGTTWQRLNDRIFILKWTVPLKKDHQVAKPERGCETQKERKRRGGVWMRTNAANSFCWVEKQHLETFMSAQLRLQQLHHSEEHFPAPNTHTHTHVYIHTQQPPSNPVRFPANSKVGSRLEHFSALATSLCLPFRPFSTFVPLLASLFSIYRFLFTSKTTAKGTFLSVIQKTMVKSENCTWSRMRKCSHDGKKVRIPLEETAEAWNMHLPRSSRHVSILNIYIWKEFLM